MGNFWSSETGRDAQLPDHSESGDTGPLTGGADQTDDGEHNNLFFHTTVDNDLAGDAQIQPRSTRGPHRSPASSRTLRPNSGAGVVDTDAWVDAIFSAEAYDRNWISKHDVNDDILEGRPSKHKLNALVRHGAVFIDDELCVTYLSSGSPEVKKGVIQPESTSNNLSVRITPAGAGFERILQRVQGPRDLIRGMNEEYAARYDGPVPEGWKNVRVVSSTGEDCGTLFEVRQAYQVWMDEKAKWVARKRRAGSG